SRRRNLPCIIEVFALASSPDFRHHLTARKSMGRRPNGNADQAAEAANRLPERLYQGTRLRTHAGRSRSILWAVVARHRAQASAQPRAEGVYQAPAQS